MSSGTMDATVGGDYQWFPETTFCLLSNLNFNLSLRLEIKSSVPEIASYSLEQDSSPQTPVFNKLTLTPELK